MTKLLQPHPLQSKPHGPFTNRFVIFTLVAMVLFNFSISYWDSVGLAQEPVVAAAENQPTAAEVAQNWKNMEYLGVPVFDDDIYKLIVRFAFNLFFLSLVVLVSYCPHHKNNQRYVFNFLIMNVVVFFICFTLKKLELELGMALGLFAIFAIIRYRTDQINVKDMTYLFVVIGLAVINALSNRKTSYVELVFTNAAVFMATLLLERSLTQPKKVRLAAQDVIYDKLELLKPENEAALNADLLARTGIQPVRVEIKKIDMQKQSASITIRYNKQEKP